MLLELDMPGGANAAGSNATGAKRVSSEGKQPDRRINDAAREVGGQAPAHASSPGRDPVEAYFFELVEKAASARQAGLERARNQRSQVFDEFFGINRGASASEQLFPAAAETTQRERVSDTPPDSLAEALLDWAPRRAAQIVEDSYVKVRNWPSKVFDDYFGIK